MASRSATRSTPTASITSRRTSAAWPGAVATTFCHPASVSRAIVTRPLPAQGSRATQPCCSSRDTTWESRESDEATVDASSLIGMTWPSVSESMARTR